MPCRCVPAVDIVLYSLEGDRESQEIRTFFDSNGIVFQEVHPGVEPNILKRIATLSKQTERPVLVINGEVLVGFDRKQIARLIPAWGFTLPDP